MRQLRLSHAAPSAQREQLTVPIHSFIHLERANGTPLYRQISQGLREAILAGELLEGTRLPTERALAQELGVNRTTIMNAYNELSSEGMIEGHVGRGTLVKRGYTNPAHLANPDDPYLEQETPSWLFGLADGEDEKPKLSRAGSDIRSENRVMGAAHRGDFLSVPLIADFRRCTSFSVS